MKNINKILLTCIFLFGILIIAGCAKTDITPVVKALPEVKEFLKENPNAQIRVIYWDTVTVSENIDKIKTDCDFAPAIKPYWYVTIKEDGVDLTIYLDSDTKQPMCIFQRGKEAEVEETIKTEVKAEEGIVCEKPYIRHGTDCCLDKNDNKICDKDEKEETKETVKAVVKKETAEVKEEEIVEVKPTTTETKKTTIKTTNYLDEPFMGDEDAPVVIEEFSDFQCPFCARFFSETEVQIINEYVNKGKVKFIYRDFPLESIHPQAFDASLAGACAQEQNKYWKMHDKLYQNQYDLSISALKRYTKDISLDTSKFNECLDSRRYEAEIKDDINEGTNKGVRGTPTFYINGQELVGAQPFSAFKEIIDEELGIKTEEETPPTQAVASPISESGEPYLGISNAQVVIVEYGDYQDPFGARFFTQTEVQLINTYINTGKVKFIFKEFPLESIHPYARKASEAAECAMDQNKYWNMHDKLYQNQYALDISDLKQYAKDIGLDTSKFNTCLDTGTKASEVTEDIQEGLSVGVTGTPTFYIKGKSEQWQELVGAQPFSALQAVIESELP